MHDESRVRRAKTRDLDPEGRRERGGTEGSRESAQARVRTILPSRQLHTSQFLRTFSSPSDRNWLEFLSILDATFSDVSKTEVPDEAAKTSCAELINKTQEFLALVAERDGVRDRSGPLALLELELRARKFGLSTGALFRRARALPVATALSLPFQTLVRCTHLWSHITSNLVTRHVVTRTCSRTSCLRVKTWQSGPPSSRHIP